MKKKNLIRAMFVVSLMMTSINSWGATSEDASSPGETWTYEGALSTVSDLTLSNGVDRETVPAANQTGLTHAFRSAESLLSCESCEIHLGVGGTYHSWKDTRGVVLPVTVTWDRGRYEFGLFRFATEQSSEVSGSDERRFAANPYWGASLSRRWQLLHRGPVRAFLGFGVSYKTETDVLSATSWNFASQLGIRVQPERSPVSFELSSRHWSNGGVKTPNRGQDFTILTVRFDR
jgi:hypothetical protein